MKDLKDRLINEGWPTNKGNRAYDEISDVWENMKQEDILNMIWNYFPQDQLEFLYRCMEKDGYFD